LGGVKRTSVFLGLALWATGCGTYSRDVVLEQSHMAETALRDRGLEYSDPTLQAYLESLAALLAAQAPVAPPRYRIVVLRDPVLNAFALPDGTIYLSVGALATLDDESQLALLLAHELNHLALEHAMSVFGIGGAKKSRLPTSPGIALAPFPLLSNRVFQVAIAGYSPELEQQADLGGMQWLARAGFASTPACGLFEAFDDVDDPRVVDALWNNNAQNHERASYCRSLVHDGSVAANPQGRNDVAAFRRAVEAVTLENLRLRIGSGEYELALVAAERATARYGESAPLHYYQGQSLLFLDRLLDEAESHMRQALALDPGYPPAQRGLADVALARSKGGE
jgi:tetratricopeptide (TPR) repeat protein